MHSLSGIQSFKHLKIWYCLAVVATTLLWVCWYSWSTENYNLLLPVLEPAAKFISSFSESLSANPKDNCLPLLTNGRFVKGTINQEPCWFNHTLSVKHKRFSQNCYQLWEPFGCTMKYYSEKDLSRCLLQMSSSRKAFLFIGDSRMRAIYVQFAQMLHIIVTEKGKQLENANTFQKKTNTTLEFHSKVLARHVPEVIRLVEEARKQGQVMLVYGIALHDIKAQLEEKKKKQRYGKTEKLYAQYLHEAKLSFDRIGNTTKILWMVQPPYTIQHLGQTACEIHGLRKASSYYNQALVDEKNRLLNVYNKIAIKIFDNTSVNLWFSAKRLGELSKNDYCDVVHLRDYSNANYAQIIANFFCNSRMELNQEFCCS